jgi:hypothetical protein
MTDLRRVLRIVTACAAVGVLAMLVAVIASIVRSLNGTPNHLSGDHLMVIFLIGAAVGFPLVRSRLSHKRARDPGDPDYRQ